MSDLLSSFGAGTEQAYHQEKERTSNIVAQYLGQIQPHILLLANPKSEPAKAGEEFRPKLA